MIFFCSQIISSRWSFAVFHKNSKRFPFRGCPVSPPSHHYMTLFRLCVTMRPPWWSFHSEINLGTKVTVSCLEDYNFDSTTQDFPAWYSEIESQHLLSLGSKLITLYSAKLPFHPSSNIASSYNYKEYSWQYL